MVPGHPFSTRVPAQPEAGGRGAVAWLSLWSLVVAGVLEQVAVEPGPVAGGEAARTQEDLGAGRRGGGLGSGGAGGEFGVDRGEAGQDGHGDR